MRIFLVLITLILCSSATCTKIKITDAKNFYPLKQKMNLYGFSDECKKFIKREIRPNWLLHTSEDCYYDNRQLWESILRNKECFIGRNKYITRSIFGSPNKSISSNTDIWEMYYMGKVCEKYYWYFNLQFHYDENKILKNIGQGQVSYH